MRTPLITDRVPVSAYFLSISGCPRKSIQNHLCSRILTSQRLSEYIQSFLLTLAHRFINYYGNDFNTQNNPRQLQKRNKNRSISPPHAMRIYDCNLAFIIRLKYFVGSAALISSLIFVFFRNTNPIFQAFLLHKCFT